ncbi:MAG: PD40 domain-containing protein [Bacteroidaceae bacterium]|nr:PD40 domain-containing protein [Bacteroidaceae bacterium]
MKPLPTRYLLVALLALAGLAACAPEARVPDGATPVKEQAAIYPDYIDVTVPPNIAPLNFLSENEGDAFVAAVRGKAGEIVAAAGSDAKLQFDPAEWRRLLQASKGQTLSVTLYARRDGAWVSFPAWSLDVAPDNIDRYLSYRLIEPSYELYRQLGLYQRDLETFDEFTIYENNRDYEEDNNHCVNCHNYQAYDTKRMLFHVRAKHGGTVFIQDGKVRKMNMKVDSVLSNCVYPTWHPTQPWVVFSSNLTGQAFQMRNQNKIEVVDYGSDLVFYDAERGTLTNILKTDLDMETFPCWAPDGRKLYYCMAHVDSFVGKPDSVRPDIVMQLHDSLRYNIYSLTFDPTTRRFGEPQIEVRCDTIGGGQSATVPRVSPDGRYLLFTLGGYGQFHIWHGDSEQWVKDLQTGRVYPLTAANSPEQDSYHTWSSNGRWIAFSSRREDANFTRPAIAYFDRDGRPRKAFILPQEDPEYHRLFFKSYNVPELTRSRVPLSPDQLRAVIYDDEVAGQATYLSR